MSLFYVIHIYFQKLITLTMNESGDEEISEYEALRRRNIAENMAMLKSLGLVIDNVSNG